MTPTRSEPRFALTDSHLVYRGISADVTTYAVHHRASGGRLGRVEKGEGGYWTATDEDTGSTATARGRWAAATTLWGNAWSS